MNQKADYQFGEKRSRWAIRERRSILGGMSRSELGYIGFISELVYWSPATPSARGDLHRLFPPRVLI
ncbi:Hypothetical protein NTJ_00094 [Nesidiocoris tenuis]|uniref:Uncharacterized protein n=1 Tax=Nesidiocoris tenuis TaxID=355587 RepID=A0ABN7A7T3_9HEMI|nr:Hypothetical protein NTJ_00094 [Nesidiocoris tenuis]